MLGLAPSLDQALHAMEAQRVHLGASGLSSGDIQAWLRKQDIDALFGLSAVTAALLRSPPFMASDVSVDVAEGVLNAERVDDTPLPPPVPSETTDFELPLLNTERLDHFVEHLRHLETEESLARLVETLPFDEASYRLSLLPLIGERGTLAAEDPAVRLADLPLTVQIGDALDEVLTGEVYKISAGQVRPRGSNDG
jgi:hypothetical protein